MKRDSLGSLNRRDFIKTSAAAAAAFSVFGRNLGGGTAPAPGKSIVVLIKTKDRAQGVKDALRLLQVPALEGRAVMLKPNFNTADPAPGSTHNDTLRQLVLELKTRGAGKITLGESSGPPQTKNVMDDKGIPALARELGFDVLNFEELAEDGWTHFAPAGNHWQDGFSLPRAVVESPFMVSTCCLKTHGFGGHFSMSLKLAVGLTPKSIRRELHSKRDTDMRKMIAELNQGYQPKLIVLDGVDAFVDGGPSTGKKVEAGVVIGGTDRVAVDAVGVAVLKELGSNATIMSRKVFDQDQIRRAVEIGLGVTAPDRIEIVSSDAAGRGYADKILGILKEG
jgi:uncharacterized protein (DUF362 family)